MPRLIDSLKPFLICSILSGLIFFAGHSVAKAQTPFKIEVSSFGTAGLGDTISIPMVKAAGSEEIHGYDFTLGYDTTMLTFLNVNPGILYNIPGIYEWEYFTDHAAVGSCTGNCPEGMLRFVSLAEIINGPHHPLEEHITDGTALFTINFRVKTDTAVLCSFAPIRFFWMDCGDNAISYPDGIIERLGISDTVRDFQGIDITQTSHTVASYYGAPQSCIDTSYPNPAKRFINFKNGGIGTIQSACTPVFLAIGDINLDGINYEIADAALFADYFFKGLSAFTISIDGQIKASDVKSDNIPVTVEDFVYLDRVIQGKLQTWPFYPPMTTESFNGILGIAETDSSLIVRTLFEDSVSALHLCFYAPNLDTGWIRLKALSGLDSNLAWGYSMGDSLKIFISQADDSNFALIDSGLSDLFEIVVGSLPKPIFAYASASGFWAQHVDLSIAALPNLAPVFDSLPIRLINTCFGGFQYTFYAHDPNIPPDEIEYHIVSGPGQIDSVTGEWTFIPLCLDTGTTMLLELCASDIVHPCPQPDTILHAYVQIAIDTFPPLLGDANNSGGINALDITYLINYIYKGGPEPIPLVAVGDANGDMNLNILDITYEINYLYKNGPAPKCPN